MDTINPAQLGVASVLVAVLLAAVVALWKALGDERKAHLDDIRLVVPALAEAGKALEDFSRLGTRLLERDLLRRERGDTV